MEGTRLWLFELKRTVSAGLGGKATERTRAEKFVTAQLANIEDYMVLLGTIRVSRGRCGPPNEFRARLTTKDTILSVEL